MSKVTETKETKSTVTFDIQEFEFPKLDKTVTFHKLNDVIIIHDSENNLTFNLDQLCEKLEDMYSTADYEKVENDILAVVSRFFTQLKEEFE